MRKLILLTDYYIICKCTFLASEKRHILNIKIDNSSVIEIMNNHEWLLKQQYMHSLM